MSRRILVRVSPSGDVSVEAVGFQGKGCLDATKAIEAALGSQASRTLKPGFQRQQVTGQQQQRIGNGGGES